MPEIPAQRANFVFMMGPTADQCARRLSSINTQTPENEDPARATNLVAEKHPKKTKFILTEEEQSLSVKKKSLVCHRSVS